MVKLSFSKTMEDRTMKKTYIAPSVGQLAVVLERVIMVSQKEEGSDDQWTSRQGWDDEWDDSDWNFDWSE